MTAKEYLNQIQVMRHKVEEKKRQLEELRELATAIGSFDYSKDKIVSSPTGDTLEKKVIKVADKQTEYVQEIVKYLSIKERIVEEINLVENETYRMLLIKRYAEGKRLEEISVEMCMTYEWVRHLHGMALQEFERIRKERTNDKF